MNQNDFKPILALKLGTLFSGTIEQLEAEELKKITPVAAFAVELCPEADREAARALVRQKIRESNKEILYRVSPVLRDAEAVVLRNHAAMVQEVTERIEKHRAEIGRVLLHGRSFTEITGISGDGADVHNHGRLTLTVETPEGKFLYKPHSCKTDCAVFALARQYFSDTLRVPNSLDFGEYGFCEFIENRPAETYAEAAEYYTHFGGVTALIQALGGTDFHSENFLASGVYPVPIDLETVLTPTTKHGGSAIEPGGFLADYNRSISASGILPKRGGVIQFSPLLSQDDRNASAPVVDGQIQTVLDYRDAFFAGFDRIYDRCISLKAELADTVRALSAAPIRKLIRNTDSYIKLMLRLNAPDAAQDADGQARILDRLSRHFTENGLTALLPIAQAEQESLAVRDVPYFYTLGGSRDLYSGGRIVAEEFFEASAVENALCRIDRLSPAEKEFEKGILARALDCALIPSNERTPVPNCGHAAPMSRDEAVSLAGELLRQIYDLSLPAPCGKRGILGHTGDGDSFSCLPLPLATGTCGIALFAAAAAALDGSLRGPAEALTEIANDSLGDFFRYASAHDELPPSMRDLGLTSGAAGLLTYLRLARQYGAAGLPAADPGRLARMADDLPLETCDRADLYSGLAGLILSLYPMRGETDVLPAVRRAADRLLELKTLESGGRMLWNTVNVRRAISGYGHGCGGIGMALLLAWELTGCAAYRAAAEDAYAFEHEIYQEKLGTWPDLRSSPVPDGNMFGICSGAPGIALCMGAGKTAGIPSAGADLERAYRALLRQPLLPRDTLCCGNASAVEALVSLGDREAAAALLGRMREKAKQTGSWRFTSSSYQPFFSPALFHGAAGLGYALLRFAAPERIVSIFL